MANLVILNYSIPSVEYFTAPANLDSEQIEEWITDNTEHRLKDCSWISSADDTPLTIINEHFAPYQTIAKIDDDNYSKNDLKTWVVDTQDINALRAILYNILDKAPQQVVNEVAQQVSNNQF